MISVVLPTIWKMNFHEELIKLNANDVVGEIFLINNDHINTPTWFNFSDYSKLVEIKPQQNIFVNPSWNIGVSVASFNNLMIHSDDMVSSYNFLKDMDHKLNNEDCIIGIGETCYKPNDDNYFLEAIDNRNFAWGCIMFLRKSSYKMLPYRLWHGDDLLVELFKHKNKPRYKIENANMSNSKISTTIDLPEFEWKWQESVGNFDQVKHEYVSDTIIRT